MRFVALLICPFLLFACVDEPRRDGLLLEAQLLAEDGDCPHQEQLIDPEKGRFGDELEGDVDGDGDDDEIYLQRVGRGTRACEVFVAAYLPEGDTAVIVSEPVWEIGAEGGLPEPRLNALIDIDGEPGLEILVDEMSGASTQFVGAFVLTGSKLERIEAPAASDDIWSGAAQGVFPYGGSVGHIEGADCHADGGIVVSAALPAGPSANTYVVVRRYFDIEGAELTLRDTERPIATAKEVFDDFPEFRASPFGSCPNN